MPGALRVRVSQLRKALRAGGDVLVTRPPGYALLVPRDGLDLWRFERGLDEGERSLATDPQRALDALSPALAEWRGRPLVDVAYAPFAQAAVVRLEELRASALELRIEAELALGHHVRLIAELQGLTSEYPLQRRHQLRPEPFPYTAPAKRACRRLNATPTPDGNGSATCPGSVRGRGDHDPLVLGASRRACDGAPGR